MCGIFGRIGDKDNRLLKEMGKVLSHRGPDDQHEYVEGKVGLGYRRLAIIDTKGSFQPLFNEDKSIVLFFNGEIYNYKLLREKLKKHKFKTNGDGETLIHWYEERGIEGLKDVNGMFGLALYDRKRKKIFLARDRFGVKPLYYTNLGGHLSFASEIKALLIDPQIEHVPNDKIIYQYLVHRIHDNTEDTFFRGIKRLESAHYLVANENGEIETIEPYWTPSLKEKNDKSDEENIAEFGKLFHETVEKQLIADVPVGSCLSGGLDSSAIVCEINKIGGSKYQKTFSAVFPGEVNNEEDYIDAVVQKTAVEDYKIKSTPKDLWNDLEKLVYHQDEPFVSSGQYAQWAVAKKAATEVRVVLDGQGADELLAGYIPYIGVYLRDLWKKGDYLTFSKEVFFSMDLIVPFIREKVKAKLGMYQQISPKSVLRKDFIEKNHAPSSVRPAKDLRERLFNDLFYDCIPALLRYEDRNSMAHSLESRVPFLDNELVDFMLSLGANYRIRRGWNKWIMRQALVDLLPEIILKRRWKVGFTTPEIAWMRVLGDPMTEIFLSDSFKNRKYFNQEEVLSKFKDYLDGKTDDSLIFWRLLNLELWLRIFIDAKTKPQEKN